MSVAPDSRLGSYEVVALLGAGGPASAREIMLREIWRGLAAANEPRCR